MTTPNHTEAPSRIELPGGWYFKQETKLMWRLHRPDGLAFDLMSVDHAHKFAAAMSRPASPQQAAPNLNQTVHDIAQSEDVLALMKNFGISVPEERSADFGMELSLILSAPSTSYTKFLEERVATLEAAAAPSVAVVLRRYRENYTAKLQNENGSAEMNACLRFALEVLDHLQAEFPASQRPNPEPDAKNVAENINRAYVDQLSETERVQAELDFAYKGIRELAAKCHDDMRALLLAIIPVDAQSPALSANGEDGK